jgi:hypothetical protein
MIPRRYAPFVYGIIQATITTGIGSGIASLDGVSPGEQFWGHWLHSWALAWLVMVPIVVFISPFIQRVVMALTSH